MARRVLSFRLRALTRASTSLVGRVTLASAGAAALGGAVAAMSMGVTAKELVAKQETKSLEVATKKLAKELREELEPDDDDRDGEEAPRAVLQDLPESGLAQLLAHELGDVKIPGAMAVIRARDRVLAGDPALPSAPLGACELARYDAWPVRSCTVALAQNSLTLVARIDAERDRNILISRALLVGLSLAALLGAAASYWISRWALRPLTLLRDQVRAIRPDEPEAASLGQTAAQIEIEELRAALASLVTRLGAALRQAQNFAADAAHELRTPLTTIAGELELIAEASERADQPALARVRRQVSGLTELVQRLLVLARATRLDACHAEAVDLGDLARTAERELPEAARARLRVELVEDLIVRGDSALLTSLLANGLDNALKFSRDDVTMSLASQDGYAQIDIIDAGPGVAATERERVFTPFYRTPGARSEGTPGHGVGLALIARVAWAHNGSAELLDTRRGAHLRVRIPTWKPEP